MEMAARSPDTAAHGEDIPAASFLFGLVPKLDSNDTLQAERAGHEIKSSIDRAIGLFNITMLLTKISWMASGLIEVDGTTPDSDPLLALLPWFAWRFASHVSNTANSTLSCCTIGLPALLALSIGLTSSKYFACMAGHRANVTVLATGMLSKQRSTCIGSDESGREVIPIPHTVSSPTPSLWQVPCSQSTCLLKPTEPKPTGSSRGHNTLRTVVTGSPSGYEFSANRRKATAKRI